jgi:hypothetical protein
MNPGVQGLPEPVATTAIQQSIDRLNEHYINIKIDLRELLDGL